MATPSSIDLVDIAQQPQPDATVGDQAFDTFRELYKWIQFQTPKSLETESGIMTRAPLQNLVRISLEDETRLRTVLVCGPSI